MKYTLVWLVAFVRGLIYETIIGMQEAWSQAGRKAEASRDKAVFNDLPQWLRGSRKETVLP